MSNPKNNSDQTSRQNEYSAEDRRLSQGSSIHSHSYWKSGLVWFCIEYYDIIYMNLVLHFGMHKYDLAKWKHKILTI